jgi:hypothetical protein
VERGQKRASQVLRRRDVHPQAGGGGLRSARGWLAPPGMFLARNRRTQCRNDAILVTEGKPARLTGVTDKNIEHVIEEHAAKIMALAARAQIRMAVRKYYVYVWIRHTGEPIYVGKGCGPRAYREFEKGNVHLSAILRKDREAGFPDPQRILVAQNLTENEAFDREMREIALHRRTKDGGTLTNMTDGGPGKAGDEAEIRRRLKALDKFRKMYVANSQRPTVFDYEECRRQAA